MELSQKLKELRKKQGLTQLELAERLFVSRQAISGWEAGTSRPSTENLQSLSRLFNIKKPEIENPSEAVSYMQDRLETYTVPLYDLQEEVIGEFEIGCAMDVTGYSLEEAKEMVNLGERAGSVLSVEQTSLINGNFPKNVRGETYGTALMAEVVGEMPDLQAAIGTNDQEGYVRTSDLSHPKFETPQDALEWQKTQPDSYYIPLYDFQGNEIGSFLRERNNLTIAEMEAMKG